ncbi:hypothetical protein BT96DRAFT_927072, partial [Gymnopus androsaceus JB14]
MINVSNSTANRPRTFPHTHKAVKKSTPSAGGTTQGIRKRRLEGTGYRYKWTDSTPKIERIKALPSEGFNGSASTPSEKTIRFSSTDTPSRPTLPPRCYSQIFKAVTYDYTFSLGDNATFAKTSGMAGCFTSNVIRASLIIH